MSEKPKELTLASLQGAVRSAAAIRFRVKLNGTGGDGDKVFPPTYAGGVYAVEDRRIDGKVVRCARLHSAAALYTHCPTALIFGTWDSTAGEGLDSAKIPRAVVSEIIGVEITPGVRTASRIDPLGIRAQSATVYRLKDDEDDWTLD